jgi:hypothetical protein
MRSLCVISCALLVLIAFPALAQSSSPDNLSLLSANPASCSLAGTWYAGSDPTYSYLWSFTPSAQDRFFSVTELAGAGVLDPSVWGYMWTTAWSGEAVKTGPATYEWWGIQYLIWDPAAADGAGVDGSSPELDVGHSTIRFLDCNTLISTIDYYGGYFAFDNATETPFVTPLDVNWLDVYGVTTIVETYHRMPTPSVLGSTFGKPSILSGAKTPRVLKHPRIR